MKGIFKRFDIPCFGKQKTLEDIKKEKDIKFKELKKNSEEYDYLFLKYIPEEDYKKKSKTNSKTKSKIKKKIGNFTRKRIKFFSKYI